MSILRFFKLLAPSDEQATFTEESGKVSIDTESTASTLNSNDDKAIRVVLTNPKDTDINEQLVYTKVNVNTTATPLYVGADNLVGRHTIMIQPKGKTIFIGWDNTVTGGNVGTGMKISSNSMATISVSAGTTVYGITSSGTANVHITEEL